MSTLSSALKKLVDATSTATSHMVSPFKTKSLPRNMDPIGLTFSDLANETQAVSELNEDVEDGWVKSILSWLMQVATTLIKSVSVHSHVLKAQQLEVNSKADAAHLAALQLQVATLERDCDEARQRGLKGNLIISSPNLANKPSLLHPKKVKDPVTGEERNENYLEVCVRAIQAKTGVQVPKEDVYACHPISRRGVENNTMFVICLSNRRTGSAWDSIACGLVSGKNAQGEFFTKANVFVSFQLTPKRAQQAKLARQSLGMRGGLARLRIDANGKVSVKLNSDSHNWFAVTDLDHLKGLIQSEKAKAARGGSPSHK